MKDWDIKMITKIDAKTFEMVDKVLYNATNTKN